MCEIWGVSVREDAFSWGCKTGRKCVQNACEANSRVKTHFFCGRVMDARYPVAEDGWVDILGVQYVCVCSIYISFAYR